MDLTGSPLRDLVRTPEKCSSRPRRVMAPADWRTGTCERRCDSRPQLRCDPTLAVRAQGTIWWRWSPRGRKWSIRVPPPRCWASRRRRSSTGVWPVADRGTSSMARDTGRSGTSLRNCCIGDKRIRARRQPEEIAVHRTKSGTPKTHSNARQRRRERKAAQQRLKRIR